MAIRKNLRSQRGVTLVELIVALAILGFVLAAVYSFYYFGERSFAVGSEQSNLQRDLRLAADFITREVRHAVELDLIPVPASFAAGYSYIFLENSAVVHVHNGVKTAKTGPVVTGLSFGLERLRHNDRNVLQFTVRGRSGNQQYELSTRVFLSNVRSKENTQNAAVRYKKP